VWDSVLGGLHSQLVSFLRGTSPSAEVSDGVLSVDLLVIIGNALERLQEDGVIEVDIQIPDMSADENREAFVARLNGALNRDLPEDFGTIRVANVQRLQAASSVVQTFDILVYVMPLLAALFTLLAIALAERRKRAVLWIVFGVELLLILALAATTYLGQGAAESIAAQDGPTLAIAIGGELSESLGGWIAAWVVAFALVGVVGYLLVRRRKSAPPA
jgi:hypothetical protein